MLHGMAVRGRLEAGVPSGGGGCHLPLAPRVIGHGTWYVLSFSLLGRGRRGVGAGGGGLGWGLAGPVCGLASGPAAMRAIWDAGAGGNSTQSIGCAQLLARQLLLPTLREGASQGKLSRAGRLGNSVARGRAN